MNLLIRPQQPPEDDLDGLLRAFFQAEMPHPWPSPKALPPRSVRAPRAVTGPRLWRSRLALAASIALLVLGSLLLGSRLPGDSKPLPRLPQDPTANKHDADSWDPRLPGPRTQPPKAIPMDGELPFTENIEVGPKGTTYRLDLRPAK